jgi:outer membrane protein assembly factor BamB
MRAGYVISVGLMLLLVGCGGDDDGSGGAAGAGGATGGAGGNGGAGGSSGGSGGAGGSGGSGGSGGPASGSVLQYHNHATRDGVYVDAALTKAAVMNLHVDPSFAMATYAAPAYAQPLYLAGAGSVPDLVIQATNQNHVIGFHAATGAKVWDVTLGPPVPKSSLASLKNNCGNIDFLGVIGTPVIDAGSRTIYLSSEQASGSTSSHNVYALDADTGATRSGWPVDVSAKLASASPRFNPLPAHQRGALAIVGGRLIVPYGGHWGDCGDYRGWVVSISLSDPTQMTTFATRAMAGGIWAPGGVASDGISVFFSTGNTQAMTNSFTPPAMYGDGNTVFKLPPDLAKTGATTEYYVPTNWSALDAADDDLGGMGPLLMDVEGATPSKLVVQFGKDSKMYLIDRDAMGGQSAPLAAPVVANPMGAIVGAGVTYQTASGHYALFRGNPSGCPAGQSGALAAVKITPGSPPTAALAWCAGPAQSNKAPAVSMTDAVGTDAMVWIIGNDNKLRSYDADTGTVVFNGGPAGDTMSTVATFQTPIFVRGRVFAASNTQVYAFTP